jgi:hypothetical protein
MTKDTGGPAFPVPLNAPWEGMSLRDYFAAKAIPLFEWSLMTQADGKNVMDSFSAERCYMVADAMLRAREET